MNHQIEAKITGRVQMVMFRDFVWRKAMKLGLYGTVQNSDDGGVRVVAEGGEVELKKLIKYLHKGPVLALTKNVEVVWKDSEGTFRDFSIVF